MSLWDLLTALRRGWFVLLAGLAATAWLVWGFREPVGVYWAVTKAIFLLPSAYQPNQLAPSGERAIALAGIVERDINGPKKLALAVSPEVTLVDQGILDGWAVDLPNSGGQWAIDYSDPVLVVQATADSPEVVAQRIHELVAQIESELTVIQDADQVVPEQRVTLTLSPPEVTVVYSSGNRTRAMGAAGLLGTGLSLGLAAAVGGARRPRRAAP